MAIEIDKKSNLSIQKDEAKYFKDLILKETGEKSIKDWEEKYKKKQEGGK